MVGVEQSIGNDDILPPGGSKDNDLGNIIRRKRVAATDWIHDLLVPHRCFYSR